MAKPTPRRAALAACIFALLAACKPAEEPARRVRDAGLEVAAGLQPPAESIVVTERVGAPLGVDPIPESPPPSGDAPPLIGDFGAPDAGPATEVTSAPGGDAAVADDETTPEVTDDGVGAHAARADELPAALVAELAREVPADAREEARRLNKLGLDAHRKLSLDLAKDHYVAALEAFPAFPFARYNLACAFALQKRDAEALHHLAVLAHLADRRGDEVSRDRLAAARIDADFDLLRADPRFRALTGATEIQVGWAAGAQAASDRKEAQRLVKLLRERRWPARLASTPWQPPGAQSGVRVRAGDPIAETTARAIADLLLELSEEASPRAWPIEIGAALPPEAPPIVVLVAPAPATPPAARDGDAAPAVPDDEGDAARTDPPTPEPPAEDAPPASPLEPAAAPAPEPAAAPALADLLGQRMRAQRATRIGVEHHRLELKATGFFTWELTRPDGVRKRRTGRWSGAGEELLVTVTRETTETSAPDDPSAPPHVRVDDGLAREHPLRLEAGGVALDGLSFQ